VDYRAELLMEWLEGEGERRRRRFAIPLEVGYPTLRGWIHVGVGVLTVAFAAAVFVCWLPTAWQKAGRPEKLWLMQLEGPTGTPQSFGVDVP
jgi:hypothetical protein